MDRKLNQLASQLEAIECELLSLATAETDIETLYTRLAETEKKIRLQLRKETARTNLHSDAASFFGVKRKYNIILADPAWKYRTPTWRGGTNNHYGTMEVSEMRKMPVLGLAAEDAVLLMWATWPKMEEAISLIRDWGFTYKTVFMVWIKQNKGNDKLAIGNGCYTRANSEPLLLAVRGLICRYQQRDNFVSVHISRKEKHSAKPVAIHEKIFERFGDLPRIELFARTRQRGWDAWGNQCENLEDVDSKETQLKTKQDFLSQLAYKTVRGLIQQKPEIHSTRPQKRARVFAQTIHIINESI